ncbi:hypothetical protein NSA56_16930 [Oceanobacillus caeni]|uniref:hypothetical protein n=1 Tax=Oceanobacillus TaxID=182709 RepID=UPI0006219308|nr:hypothetical protein [Oceanobacillus caeni]KKE79511.1 hypothetical protein WH51_05300 [Bacilli bacterium VT-13-104]PZD89780.1 hypothetical protein DEJ64_01745 [Bacilli bacterium]MBU8791845.1 hypothetical protein [Oceanobacillus caeni]MCR1836023.1 hypothetical protein [Oceanobacillus caeni]MED4473494.1 hypothetical protein [Oceanobacillus caeni]
MKKIAIFIGVLITGIIVLLLSITNENLLPVSAEGRQFTLSSEYMETGDKMENKQLTHEDIVFLTNEFMDILVQPTDINGRVIDFHTKEELLKEFEGITTKEVAMPYVDFYYKEKGDGLYIVPTETPPWFVAKNEYKIDQINETKVILTQKNQVDLYGDYTIEIEFTYNGDWKISSITHR